MLNKNNTFLMVVASIILVASFLVVPCASKEGPKGWPKSIAWGTASPGGTFYITTAAMSNVATKYVGIPFSNTPGGSAANINGIKEGTIDIAQIFTENTYMTFTGTGVYVGKQTKNIRHLFRFYNNPWWLQTVEGSGVATLRDAKGKRFSYPNPIFPIKEYVGNLLLEANGLTPSDVQVVKTASVGEQNRLLSAGGCDVQLQNLPPSTPSIQELARRIKLRVVPNTQAEIDFLTKRTTLTPYTMKKDSFPGCDKDTPTLAMYCNEVARAEVPDDLIYAVVRAVFEHLDELKPAHAVFAELTLKNAIEGAPAPFHAGAIKYYKEKGVWTKKLDASQKDMLAKIGAKK